MCVWLKCAAACACRSYLHITGRKKELIITAGGENIPPVLIETELKAALPMLSQAMVIGEGRRFLTALLTLATEVDAAGVPTNLLAGEARRGVCGPLL